MSSNNQAVVAGGLISPEQWNQIYGAVAPLSKEQLLWVSGYLAGMAQQGSVQAPVPTGTGSQAELTILYGSQTGNAKGVATEYKAKVEAAGIKAKLVSMADLKPKQIKNESHVVIVVSTHGEGDAPDDAVELHEFLGSKKAPKLASLKFAVLGLGDSSYEFFCQTAKDFDSRLEALGAKRVIERVDCDVDYDTDATQFIERVIAEFKDELTGDTGQVASVASPVMGAVTSAASQYTKKNPFTATLSESIKITGRDSVKDIRHIEISLEASGIQYQPGDALGVWFDNDEQLVKEIITLLNLDEDEVVSVADEQLSLKSALATKLELTQSYPTFVKAYIAYVSDAGLATLFADKNALRDYLSVRQINDIVRDYPATLTAQQFVDALRPITPRLYSIASSQAEVEDEVHLTVALVEYEAHGHVHQGGASGFLSKRLQEGQEVKVFVESNNNFRLPDNPDTPVIMVGPGTGIAPFRAFMQERAETEASGKNWLFFGNPNYTQDFLYQTEWQRFVKDGVLSKVSLAFSRDQQEKIYVQHRLLEQGADVFAWLEDGAHVYVCGDATHMAKDVNEALISIVEVHGKRSREEAENYVTELRRAKRYQKDVY
ncbi:assimilatory sulfite reductase (NADPH) flavoprotein subunit [Aestuariibacter sp. AA17]|uniref:Sulfite reductase [NADPH] flavoprotein alpha-component n=1 Tax=Fluctibacter corallii TaxID=2984329 RepID=A0ABT3ADI6_9ALTE|nr:assimilatory sulfite reductase (NADPH) flavoprotein subunit [Aestuariibacter sp. AA17]MCV2886637.1 assimilatory sulfite reductase (NADPH) flavoprotein subunit [Aestuariibacter sp. AA17]